jgi:prolyl-tRNA editing enzyme YbaK/EbsC (Cys-tRNA(Pro) deacylase)
MRSLRGIVSDAAPAVDRLDRLVPPVAEAVAAGWGATPAESVLHAGTDPAIAGTDPAIAGPAVFAEHYGPELLDTSADCVVVAGKRGGDTPLDACVVLSRARVDVNGVVRKQLGTRTASVAPMDAAVGQTGMEYGGITRIGLPAARPLLADPAVAAEERVLIGSGRRGKLIVPGKAPAALPGAVVLEGPGACGAGGRQ